MEITDKEQRLIDRLTEIVEANFSNENFGVNELAREVGLSHSSLHRKLKNISDHSVSQFIREVRLKRAMVLLQKQVGTVAEIAYEVGFGSSNYFSRCFHDYYGYPPGEVRIGIVSKPDSEEIINHLGKSNNHIESIAVLPFDNFTGDDSQAHLVSGMHNALINELSQLGAIRVVSKTSALTYLNSGKTIKEIASELNVEAIIEASVLSADEVIRIQIRLLNAFPDEQQLWAQTFDVDRSDIPNFSGRIIKSIANELQLTYSPNQHNLPLQLTNFIGREKEMQVIRELIRKHRIVSLTGSGGCGKTRLACELAAHLVQDYKDGVWFVDLAPITSGELVAKEIAEVLKIPEAPNEPVIDTLIEKVRDNHQLLILDNCEHLVKACAGIAWKLLQSTPSVSLSRHEG